MEARGLLVWARTQADGQRSESPFFISILLFSMNKIRQKHRNLLREPRVAISIADPANPYRSLGIRGKVVRIEDDPACHTANVLSQKYTGQDATPNMQPGEQRVAIFVEPERVFVFPFQEVNK